MNYTDWLKSNFPEMKHESSAITYGFIERAKLEVKYFRTLISTSLITISIVILFFLIFPLFGLTPFNGLYSWALFLGMLLLCNLISEKIEIYLIKVKLARLVKNA